MMELARVLADHCRTHPHAEILDIVKLIYQNEFGGGHIIEDSGASLAALRDELAAFPHSQPVSECIGDGIYRLGIGVCDFGISPETLNGMFVRSAKNIDGSLLRFKRKLGLLQSLCRRGLLPFEARDVKTYLAQYRYEGYPAVSHSRVYRDRYAPHYRLIQADFVRAIKLFSAIDGLLAAKGSAIVALEGPSGGGKSTLAGLIADVYDCNVIHMDDFFLTSQLRTPQRLAEPGGNIDYCRFSREVAKPLSRGEAVYYYPYDCRTDAFSDAVELPQKPLTVIEGVYSMHPKWRDMHDIKAWIDIDPENQRKRILKRSGRAMSRRFAVEWIPMENAYFGQYNLPEAADIFIDAVPPTAEGDE